MPLTVLSPKRLALTGGNERAPETPAAKWGCKNGTLFPHYETMTKPIHAASDHAPIYADVNL